MHVIYTANVRTLSVERKSAGTKRVQAFAAFNHLAGWRRPRAMEQEDFVCVAVVAQCNIVPTPLVLTP